MYISQLMFLVIYGVEQIYPAKLMTHHQIGLGVSAMIKFSVSVNLVMYNIGTDFSKKDNFISYQIYSLILMLIQRWRDGQN